MRHSETSARVARMYSGFSSSSSSSSSRLRLLLMGCALLLVYLIRLHKPEHQTKLTLMDSKSLLLATTTQRLAPSDPPNHSILDTPNHTANKATLPHPPNQNFTTLCNDTHMLSSEEALKLALTPPQAPLTLACQSETQQLTCERQESLVVDVPLFGFEVDTLEIRLVESAGIVYQTVLVESLFDHHGNPKPCIFKETLRHSTRFQRFNVTSICVERIPNLDNKNAQPIDWTFERAQEQAARRVVSKLSPSTRVVFGHVDEIPGRHVWRQIKYCLLDLPTNVAIHNLMGHAEYATKATFPAKGKPFTLGSPAVMTAAAFQPIHARGAYQNVQLVGGVHLTNYCFAGNRILKEWTATEARPDQMWVHKPSCSSQVAGCRRAGVAAGRLGRSRRHRRVANQELPLALQCSPDRYPEWWHKNDPRLSATLQDLHRTSRIPEQQ